MNIVQPFNETVQQVFSRISALRDALDGPQFDDQGLVNTDPRTIAVPSQYINLIPTDVQGITFSRTPAQASLSPLTSHPEFKGSSMQCMLNLKVSAPYPSWSCAHFLKRSFSQVLLNQHQT